MIKRSSKILIITISIAMGLLCLAVDLSAQEKKDDKKWEISGYFGIGGRAREAQLRLFYFNTYCVGLGLEYYLTPHISVESEINYLPKIASVSGGAPWGRSDVNIIEDAKYRLLWDINLLFYFDITKVIKKPAINLFLTVGTGYLYDHVEFTVVSLATQEQDKYEYGEFWGQLLSFGGGFKFNIREDWALRLLYKVHRFAGEEGQTNRFALALSYRF